MAGYVYGASAPPPSWRVYEDGNRKAREEYERLREKEK